MSHYVECQLLILLLLLLPLVECWCMPTSPGKAKWSGPHQRRWEENEFKSHSVTCYTNSTLSLINVNTTKPCNITCTFVATSVIIRSIECRQKCLPYRILIPKLRTPPQKTHTIYRFESGGANKWGLEMVHTCTLNSVGLAMCSIATFITWRMNRYTINICRAIKGVGTEADG